MKIKVVNTSTGCLDYYDKPHQIDIIRIKLLDGTKELYDGTDIRADAFYKRLRENPSWVPKTSQPSVGELVAYFESLAKQAYTHALVITLSSELSGTHNAVVQAAEMVKDIITVLPYDTKTVCFSEGYFALEAERMLSVGNNLEEVVAHLEYLKKNNTILFAVNDLTQLVNNGRLTGARAFLGKLLQIKPILQVQPTGKIVSIDKTRNIKKALANITEYVKEYTEGKEYFAHILYTGNPQLKGYFLEALKRDLSLEDLYEAPATPVVGAHVGPDVVGIGIFIKP